MEKQIFEYRKKISYTDFITPIVGVGLIYIALTNQGGIAYRGKLIMTYPGSAYFLTLIGVLFIIPLIINYIRSFKKNSINLGNNELNYTKGFLFTKNKTVKYIDFKHISFEDSEDDGSSIIIDSGKFSDHQFYANKFNSYSEYSEFCDQVTSHYNASASKDL